MKMKICHLNSMATAAQFRSKRVMHHQLVEYFKYLVLCVFLEALSGLFFLGQLIELTPIQNKILDDGRILVALTSTVFVFFAVHSHRGPLTCTP